VIACDPVAETTPAPSVMPPATFWQRLRAAMRFNRFTGRHYRHAVACVSVGVLGIAVPVQPSVEQAVVRQTERSDEAPAVAAAASGSAARSAPVQNVGVIGVGPKPDSEVGAEASAEIPDAPGVVTFDDPIVVAGASQPLVAMTLRRQQSTRGSAAVQWRLESGSAQPDVDYEAMKPQVVRFFEGQSVRTVFVPLIPNHASASSRAPRTFTVALQKLPGGPALGAVGRVMVTIDAAQANIP
jgi:hypothetical protein